MEEEIKTCENCRFFERHYTRNHNRLSYAHCGHCSLHSGKKKININKGCESWTDIGDKAEQRDKMIKKELLYMAKIINDIALLLEVEKNYGD